MAYEYKRDWTLGENKPNSNPIKPNLQDTQMSVNSILTKDYERNDTFAVPENKANSNPNKPNQSQFRDNSKACFSPPQSRDGLVVVYGVRQGVVIWQRAAAPAPRVSPW